jgi:hypothetical protein
MRVLFWVGIVALLLGIASLFIPLPHTETHGVKAGDVSIGIQTQEKERISPILSGILIAGGIGMMIAGSRARRS